VQSIAIRRFALRIDLVIISNGQIQEKRDRETKTSVPLKDI
jgi:hypothetical protein